MSDPLAGYKPGWQTANDDDPLAKYDPNWRSTIRDDKRNETAMGRRTTEAEAMMRQKAVLEKVIPAAVGERKARLEKQLEQLNSDLNPLGLATTASESVDRAIGGAKGAVPQMFLGTTDLVLGVAAEPLQKALSAIGLNLGAPVTKLRERIQETQAVVDEATGAKGLEGIGGNILGTLGVGAAGSVLGKVPLVGRALSVANMPSQAYGQVSTATLRFLGKAKMLEPLARAGMEGGRAARMAGSAVGDLPTNVLQALTLPDANLHDIVRSIGLGTAGSIVGGALAGKQPFDAPKPADMTDFSTPGAGTPSPEAQALAATAQRINEWQQNNPGKSWADLTPQEQAALTGRSDATTVGMPKTEATGWQRTREHGGINEGAPRIEDQATILRNYLLGMHDNLEAAHKAYITLGSAGVSSEALVSMMGMEAGIQNGNAVIMTRSGEVPTPERLLLASGQAPRALLTAGRAESDSKLNRSARLEALAIKMRDELKVERSERRRLARELERDELIPELQGKRGWEAARQSIESNPKTWLAKFDLNNFKAVNDGLGQDAGDEAIRKVGQLLAANAEAYGLRAFRIGGDEFVIAGPKGKVARARDDIEAQLFGEKVGNIEYSISGGMGQNLANAEKALKPRKIAAKTKLGQPLSRGDMAPPDGDGSTGMPNGGVSRGSGDVSRDGVDTGLPPAGSDGLTGTGQGLVKRTVNDPYDRMYELFKDTLPPGAKDASGIVTSTYPNLKEQANIWVDDFIHRQGLSKQEEAIVRDFLYRKLLSDASNTQQTRVPVEPSVEDLKTRWNAIEDRLEEIDSRHPEWDALKAESAELWSLINEAEGIEPIPPTTMPDPAPIQSEAPTKPTPTTPARPARRLASIELKKPLEELTPKEINSIVDRLLRPFDDDPELMNTPEYKRIEQDVITLNERLAEMNDKPIVTGYALEMPVEQDRLGELMAKPFKSMKEWELTELNTLLQNANSKLPPGDPLREPFIDKLIELRAYQQAAQVRKKTPPLKSSASSEDVMDVLERADLRPKKGKRGTEGFTIPEAQVSVVASGAGFLLGMALPADDEQERLRNAVIGAGILGAATMGTFYMKGKQKLAQLEQRPKYPGEEQIGSVMKTKVFESAFADMTPDQLVGRILSGVERMYAKTLRPSLGGERIARALGLGSKVSQEIGDMMATFGQFRRTAIEWYYNGPQKQDSQGNAIPRTTTRGDGTVVPIRSVAEILRSVNGDIERLGKVALGLSAIEQYTRTGKMPHPDLDVIQVSQFLGAVDKSFIDAATAMRDVHLGLLDMQLEAGIITPKAREAMASEKYYTAMERVFGDAVDASLGKDISSKVKGIFSPQPVKSRLGPNQYDIRNPVESLIGMVSRVAKAVELQDKKAAMITLWEASNIPESVKRSFMRPVTKTQAEHSATEQWNERVKILKEYLPDLSADEAQAMIAAFDPLPLGPKSDFMTFIRNGRVETWKLSPDLVETFQYMQGHEIAKVWKGLGIGSNIARTGTAMDPSFGTRMAWFDVFQSYMNSSYGGTLRDMVPGLNWVDAFYHAWKKSPEYQAFGGGSAEASMLEGIRNPADVIRRASAQGDTYTAEIWKNVKGLHLIDAYKTLLTPLAEAGRFSEFLAARRHGASVQKAIRSATAVGGYYNQVGSYAAGLFHAIPFLKGSAQSLDQAIYSSGLHPFREYDGNRAAKASMWFTKGVISIGLPTAIIYAANSDDKEIQQLRQTEYGRRFWFFRGPEGGIYSVRKPAGPEGVLFGGSVEIALDKMRNQEPEAFNALMTSMKNEVSLPYLPPAVAASGTLASGTDLAFGSPLITGRAGSMPVDKMATTNTSATAQTLSTGLVELLGEPSAGFFQRALSPVGIEYIGRALGGSLGQESFKLADAARTWVGSGSIPSAQELPVVRRFVGVDMTRAQTRDIEDFYKFATEAEKIANALAQTTERGDVEGYISITKRYGNKIYAANTVIDARRQISEYMRAIQELKAAPGDSDSKRSVILNLRQAIQVTAGQAVDAYRAIQP